MVSYFPLTGLFAMIAARSAGVIGPIRPQGGRIMQRSTIDGVPLPSRNDTSASPLPSSMITCAVSSFGLARKVLAAVCTAFWSRGVKARKRVLHAIAELRQHLVGHVERILRDEIDADALGAHQPHHLLDLLQQRLGRLVEQQMRLVEEEHELRLFRIADFRQFLEQFRQQPEQEGGVEPRIGHQLVGGEDVDIAAAVAVGLHEVLQLERGLAEEFLAALVFQHQQRPLDGADGLLGDVAVACDRALDLVELRVAGALLGLLLAGERARSRRGSCADP